MKEICSRVPKFLSNTILRSLDLKEINRNIYNASYLEFLEEDTGIITGLEVTTDGSQIYVSEGIYKYMDEIIFLDTTLSIKIPNEEKEYSLNICTKLLDEEYSVSKKYILVLKKKVLNFQNLILEMVQLYKIQIMIYQDLNIDIIL